MKKINNKGFTLVEVLAVVAIIAILGIIAVPNVLNTINSGKDSSYDILIKNTKTAGQQLFEELEYNNSTLYHYNLNGEKNGVITIDTTINNDTTKKQQIIVNFQTLVSNGLLTGINNEDGSAATTPNNNSKIILNPKTNEDMGECTITIIKTVEKNNNYKTSYSFTVNETNDNCPIQEDFNS